jgi:hypothetical protein
MRDWMELVREANRWRGGHRWEAKDRWEDMMRRCLDS